MHVAERKSLDLLGFRPPLRGRCPALVHENRPRPDSVWDRLRLIRSAWGVAFQRAAHGVPARQAFDLH
eukprot:15014966-Alexandrium_andersonii.AAC.1